MSRNASDIGAAQPRLFIDSLNEAVRQTALRLGPKEVAAKLWPAKALKDPIAAMRYLDDCLNPDRPHKLDGDEILVIAKMGRAQGIHLIAAHISEVLDYAPPQPVEPEDKKAALQREFIEAARSFSTVFEQVKRAGLL